MEGTAEGRHQSGLLGEFFAVRQCGGFRPADLARGAGMALKASRKPFKLCGLARAYRCAACP